MTKTKRKPRPPPTTGLPMTYDEACEAQIDETARRWLDLVLKKLGLDSEASHVTVADEILRQLMAGPNAALPLDEILDMAERQHPPADHALRKYVQDHMDANTFDTLPLELRAYAKKAMQRPPLPVGYASTAAQIVNDYNRDIAVVIMVDTLAARFPDVPRLHSSTRQRSIAGHVAIVFTAHGMTLSEKTVRRIYGTRRTHTHRLAAFLVANLPKGVPS